MICIRGEKLLLLISRRKIDFFRKFKEGKIGWHYLTQK